MKLPKSNTAQKIAFSLICVLSLVTLTTLIALFLDKKPAFSFKETTTQINQTDKKDEMKIKQNHPTYTKLNLASFVLKNQNLKNLVEYQITTKQYVFNKQKIDQYLKPIIHNALFLSNRIVNSKNEYNELIRYSLLDDKKVLLINYYLNNRILRNKNFFNFFKLIIN